MLTLEMSFNFFLAGDNTSVKSCNTKNVAVSQFFGVYSLQIPHEGCSFLDKTCSEESHISLDGEPGALSSSSDSATGHLNDRSTSFPVTNPTHHPIFSPMNEEFYKL